MICLSRAVQNKMVTNFLLVAVHNEAHWQSVRESTHSSQKIWILLTIDSASLHSKSEFMLTLLVFCLGKSLLTDEMENVSQALLLHLFSVN
jgi:hypothetical protein